ncbi:MAG: NAD-dependent epimerase/dehydratase family protein [Patescibacteria group bacterium]|jgi:nucleoside-diphosphate-sugar epimerase
MAKTIFEKKNVLVIGGAGFIGSHLCDELVKTSKVICLDNFLTGSEQNIDHLLENPDFAFIRHDITEPFSLSGEERALQKFKAAWQGVQEVYFLASPSSRSDVERFPIETMMVNSVGLRYALDLAKESKAIFCYVSSDATYGQVVNGSGRVSESAEGIVPHIDNYSAFAVAQRFGEALVESYRRNYGLNVRIARVFSSYGPRMRLDDSNVVTEFLQNIFKGKEVIIYGGSEAVGSFCYVSDTVKGLIRLMSAGDEQPVNIGSDQALQLTELARMMMTLVEEEVRIMVRPDYPDGYHPRLIPNITRAKENLSWFPVTLLKDGLAKTVEDLKAGRGLVKLGAS